MDLLKAAKELHAAYGVLVRGDDKAEQRWYDARIAHANAVGRIEANDFTVAVLTPEDLATVLAALRYYQQQGQGNPDNRRIEIHEIACGDGELTSLDDDGIDELCERLNGAED